MNVEEFAGLARWATGLPLVLGWLLVSFLPAGAGRLRLEWLTATLLFFFLVACVGSGLHWGLGLEGVGRWPVIIGLGFVFVLLSIGGVVSLVRSFLLLLGRTGAQAGATH